MRARTFFLALLASAAVAACSEQQQPEPPPALDEAAKTAMDANGFQTSQAPVRAGAEDQLAAALAPQPGRRTSSDTASLPSMLIRTGAAELRVDTLEPAIAALEALARRAGGYVGNTFFSGGEERRRSATLQLRVPSARFGEMRDGLAAIGEVRSLNIQVQDVGEEYTDAAARVHSKRQVEARLLELLRTRTGRLSDVVELEMALENVRSEIETTEGRLRYLRNQVGLSTMTVTLSEPGLDIAQPGYHPIRDSFGRAWFNFTTFLAGIIASLGWLVPLAAILYGAWRIARGRFVRKAE